MRAITTTIYIIIIIKLRAIITLKTSIVNILLLIYKYKASKVYYIYYSNYIFLDTYMLHEVRLYFFRLSLY